MDRVGNTTDKSMCEMKASDHETLWTCICKAGKPNHGNLPLVNISLRSRKREEPFSALQTFPQQSAKFLSIYIQLS
jgi:hypothetical protein